jgi:hypothetical protein
LAPLNIAQHRLSNQCIASARFATPGDVVAWLGAVQAQDYLAALWAVGLRLPNATDAGIERALAERSIVRTWPMRGTLHFVAAADVRWMLHLLARRSVALAAGRFRQLGLDDAIFARSTETIRKALHGNKQLRRAAMYEVLESAGIVAAGQRGMHILWRLAQDGLICYGARQGKQPTFVLLAEWVPDARIMERDEALAELARRYVTSHGPATAQDFAWWSGLTTADTKIALHLAKQSLVQDVCGEQTYWLPSSLSASGEAEQACLLPAFDEYLVGYKDRSAVLDPLHARQVNAGGGVLNPTIVIGGQVVGVWKRSLARGSVVITPTLFRPLLANEEQAVAKAAQRYAAFLRLPVLVSL